MAKAPWYLSLLGTDPSAHGWQTRPAVSVCLLSTTETMRNRQKDPEDPQTAGRNEASEMLSIVASSHAYGLVGKPLPDVWHQCARVPRPHAGLPRPLVSIPSFPGCGVRVSR